MKFNEIRFFTDENIPPFVVKLLRQNGFDVFDVLENDLGGSKDWLLLEIAHNDDRVVITHNSDFGALAFANNQPFTGIIFLKPGHMDIDITMKSIQVMIEKISEVFIPFILVVHHSNTGVKIRYRQR